jgi:flagellar protein FlgJ
MLTAPQSDVYTDFTSLAELKNQAKRKTPDATKQVAKQFESIFVGMMMKSMRQAKLAEGILDSKQSDFYRDMYDQQLSVHLAAEGGIGLADIIARQLGSKQTVQVLNNKTINEYKRNTLFRNSALKNNQSPPITTSEEVERSLKGSIAKSVKQSNKTLDTAPLNLDKNSAPLHPDNNFVNQLLPFAKKAAKELGVDAKVLISQAALETGWGKSIIKASDGTNSYNLFNIKADRSWQGQQVKVGTLEFREGQARKEIAGFRAYSSYQESFDDYVKFIKTNPRYETAMDKAQNPEQYMFELQQAGYATDPNYTNKVMKIYYSEMITKNTPDLLAMKQASTPDNL